MLAHIYKLKENYQSCFGGFENTLKSSYFDIFRGNTVGQRILVFTLIVALLVNLPVLANFGLTTPLLQNSYAVTTTPFAVSQVKLWANATNPTGFAWGAAGILNNSTSGLNVTGITVNGKFVPRQNWYVDTNQTNLAQGTFKSTYIISSMNFTGLLNESASLSPNACAASNSALRIDFDGDGPKPALCLQHSGFKPIFLPAGHRMIVYFRVPDGQILSSTIGSSLNVGIIVSKADATVYKISNKVQVKSLNNFNLRFWLHTNQGHYSDILQVFSKHLKSGDILMIGGDNNANTSIAVSEAAAAKPQFAPGVIIGSYRIYHTIGNITQFLPTLVKGYDYIVYDYEIWNTPEFTRDQAQSIIYFDQANSAIKQYNQLTGSNAKLVVAVSYWPIRFAIPTWDWGAVAKHMNQMNVMMSGYTSNPCLSKCSSSVYAQLVQESPHTVNEIQLSFAPGRDGPEKVAHALYKLQSVGVNNTLIFYDNYQTQPLKEFFNDLHYATYWK